MVHIRHLREKIEQVTGKRQLIKPYGEWGIKLRNDFRHLKFKLFCRLQRRL